MLSNQTVDTIRSLYGTDDHGRTGEVETVASRPRPDIVTIFQHTSLAANLRHMAVLMAVVCIFLFGPISGVAAAPGDLDPTFGSGGIVTTPITGFGNDNGRSVAIQASSTQSDGKIVMVGYSESPNAREDFTVVRYSHDGSLDTTFGTNGITTTDLGGSNDIAQGMAIQADGKIVVVGYRRIGSDLQFAVVRYNSNGSLDTSFANNGILTPDFGGTNDIAASVAIQSDDKIVVVGTVVARFHSDGSLDTSFDGDGFVPANAGGYSYTAQSVVIQGDGKIVVAGYTQSRPSTSLDFAVIRYNGDGSLDASFDTDGIATTDFGGSPDYARSVAIQGDGKIVVAGYTGSGSMQYFAVVRYKDDGSLDSSFDGDGIVTTSFGADKVAYANAAAIQADGKIVVAGYTYSRSGADRDFAVVRYEGVNNQPPAADAGGHYAGEEGRSISLRDATASDPDDDSLNYLWSVDSALCHFDDPELLTPNLTCRDNGQVVATLTVTDHVNPAVSSAATVTVANVAPTLSAITVDQALIPVGTAIHAHAGFTDPGTLDTHSAVWDWGDMTTSRGMTSAEEGQGTAGDSHVYATAGVYTVKLRVTDSDQSPSDDSIFKFVIVHDPNGAFVTGDGWFDSPQGAFKASPTLTGKAHFGFGARYKKGATNPTGNMRFQFKAGGITLLSTSYTWLVVAADRATVQGVGAINGTGHFGFILSATDGKLSGRTGSDALRIKIWDTSRSETDPGYIVYDNQDPTSPEDDAAPTTPIGGGSIVIHGK